jgi:hypothetical protein
LPLPPSDDTPPGPPTLQNRRFLGLASACRAVPHELVSDEIPPAASASIHGWCAQHFIILYPTQLALDSPTVYLQRASPATTDQRALKLSLLAPTARQTPRWSPADAADGFAGEPTARGRIMVLRPQELDDAVRWSITASPSLHTHQHCRPNRHGTRLLIFFRYCFVITSRAAMQTRSEFASKRSTSN